ncbi:MAG: SRPBCC family protein [Ferruginibacter sp.]
MNNLKGILIVLIGIFVFITLISVFIPSRIVTVKAVAINAPEEKILEQVAVLQNWKNWQPVFMQDSSSIDFQKTADGKPSAEWMSGTYKNKITITEQMPHAVKFSLKRDEDPAVENMISLLPVQESRSGRQVEWKSVTRLKWYPWEKFRGIFIEKMIGPAYELALNNLKAFLEK